MSAELRRFAYSFVDDRPNLSVVEWAESELSLSSQVTAQPGPYSTFNRTHVQAPLECFRDTTTTDLVLCWAAQTDKSTTLSVGTLYRLKSRPTPTLIVFPNETLAGSFSETRLIPLIESSPQLSALKPKDKDKFRKLEMHLTTAPLSLVGSNSPANLAARSAGLVVQDEINKYPGASEREAGARQLAIERTKSYEPLCKRIYASTPTIEDDDGIWSLFLQGTQEYRWLPCIHCGVFSILEWKQVKWSQEAKDAKTGEYDFGLVKSSAHYECPHCQGKITDSDRYKMMRRGEWRAANPRPMPGWRSFHLSGLFSPSLSLGKLAVSFIQAKHGSLSDLQNFTNSTLAEPWTAEKPLKVTDEHLTALLGTTDRGTYDPADGGVNLMIVDVQRDHFVWLVRRFYRGTRSHLVDWGQSLGYDQLDATFARYQVAMLAIDTSQGIRSQELYEQIAARPGKWVAIKGQPGTMGEFYKAVQIDPHTGGKQAGQVTIPLLHVNDEHWSRELFDRLDGRVSGWKLTKEIDAVYQHQITGVRRVQVKGKNGTTDTKLRYRPPFDLWDCEKYALCLSYVVGFGRADPPALDKSPTNQPPPPPREGKIEF